MGVGTIPAPISFAQESIKKSENWAEISWLRMEGMLGCSPYHRQWNSGKMILKNKGVGVGCGLGASRQAENYMSREFVVPPNVRNTKIWELKMREI